MNRLLDRLRKLESARAPVEAALPVVLMQGTDEPREVFLARAAANPGAVTWGLRSEDCSGWDEFV